MKKFFFTISLILIVSVRFAYCNWQNRIDSLKILLVQADEDTTRIRLNLDLGNNLLSNLPESSLEYFVKAKELSEQINDTNYLISSMIGISDFYTLVNEYSTSLEIVYQATKLSKNNLNLLAKCHNRLANIYFSLEDYKLSLHHNRISLQLDLERGDYTRVAVDYHNISSYFLEIDNYDSALYYIYKAYAINQNKPGHTESYHLSHLGLIYTYMNKFDSAFYYHKLAFKADSLAELNYEMCIDEYYMALTHFKNKDYSMAVQFSEKSIKRARKLKIFDIFVFNYELLYKLYESKGEYKEAFKYALLRNDYADSLRIKGKQSLIQSLETKYKFDEQQRQLTITEAKNDLLEKQKALLIILSVVSILLLTSTIIIILQISRRHKANRELLLELEKANHSKEKLISILSHDLRGSIGTLRNAVELIIDDALDYQSVNELMKSFFPVVDSTYDLLENLLTWAKYGKETLEPSFEQIDIKAVVDKSIKHTSHLADSKTIRIINNVEEASVLADRNMLQTIVRNLISNAVKFSHSRSNVTITCYATSSVAEISISDGGIGMKPEVLSKIFSTPVDYHSKGTMGERGSGLGLSICKTFVEVMGGQIWAESELGKGSTFYFTIPVVYKD